MKREENGSRRKSMSFKKRKINENGIRSVREKNRKAKQTEED